ncbi:MAG: transporter suffix domain-containing protein [Planctomycetota bacterium]
MSQASDNQQDRQDNSHAGRFTHLGIALILFSGVLWFSLFAIPFLPFSTANKAMIGGAVFIAVQIAWWGGAALAGPRVVGKVTRWYRREG